MSGLRKSFTIAVLTGLLCATLKAQQSAGCTLEKQVYTCNWQAFVQRLDHAQSISIETQSMDRFTARQLRELAGDLGKSVAPEEQAGDLTFLVIPLPSTGVHIGPSGEPLATLRIYAPEPGNSHGKLLWAEVYTGQPDRPWPATVHELLEQFHDRIQKH